MGIKITLTGGTGQLGYELANMLRDKNEYELVVLDRQTMDLSRPEEIEGVLKEITPNIIIHAGAFTAVDLAEREMELADQVNHLATDAIARYSSSYSAKMLYVSTDYVFSGDLDKPLSEEYPTGPINAYGKSKRLGELAVLKRTKDSIIIRTSWVYSSHGKNFVKTMLKLMTERQQVSVVADQFGSPTWAKDLAELIMITLKKWIPGIYHYSNQGRASWYEFALAIRDLSELNCEVIPVTSAEFPTAAQRPTYSLLDKTKVSQTFGIEISPWKDSLSRMLQEVHVS